MSLASALTPYINSKVRKRGVHYFNAGRVRVSSCGPEAALAVVTGSSLYEVTLIRAGKVLQATCSCPFSDRGEPCKHVWAALLAVDARGGLRGRDGTLPQRLVVEASEEAWDADDEDQDLAGLEDEGFADEEFQEDLWEAPPQYSPVRPQAVSRAPSVPTWRETIDRLAGAGRRAEPPKVGQDKEILYVLDLPRSLSSQELALELSTRKRKRDGSWGKPQRLSLRRAELPRLPDSADRKLLSLLGEASSGYSWPGAYYSSYSDQVSPYREIPAE